MPNKVGGKNYKKGKHQDDPKVYERLEGQMYGRVLKLLGGCNAMVFCNDNKERLCHIRGNMRRKVWIEVGDIVLISLRDLSDESDPTFVERGDICAKYFSAAPTLVRSTSTLLGECTIAPSAVNFSTTTRPKKPAPPVTITLRAFQNPGVVWMGAETPPLLMPLIVEP